MSVEVLEDGTGAGEAVRGVDGIGLVFDEMVFVVVGDVVERGDDFVDVGRDVVAQGGEEVVLFEGGGKEVEEEVDYLRVFRWSGLEFAPFGCEAEAVFGMFEFEFELFFVGVEDVGDGLPIVVVIDRERFVRDS